MSSLGAQAALQYSMANRVPSTRRPARSREHFEELVIEITGCKIGDGTLQVNETAGRYYKNPHVQYMWELYRTQ